MDKTNNIREANRKYNDFSNPVAVKLICIRTQESFDTFYMSHPVSMIFYMSHPVSMIFYMSHPVSMILTTVMIVRIQAVMRLNLMIEEVKTKIEK